MSIRTDPYTAPLREIDSPNSAHGQRTNSRTWNTPSAYYGYKKQTTRTLQGLQEPFEFHYNYETFGQLNYNLPLFPQPLPNSPPHNWRRPRYHPRGTSRLIGGASNEAGGSGGIPQPTDTERLDQAIKEIGRMRRRQEELEKELEDTWAGKGKEPLCPGEAPRGQPLPLNPMQLLYQRMDRYSVPWPPDDPPPDPFLASIGRWNEDMLPLFLGIKPILLQPPCAFKGDHDVIKWFLGDCLTYFDMFQHYYRGIPSLMVTFASALFEGPAEDWWVQRWLEYWSNSDNNGEPPQFQYPPWDDFIEIINAQFWDPAIEEVHEKHMYDLHMKNNPVTTYFQRLEEEAKLAGLRSDEREWGPLVKAVWLGVPSSYTTFIANTSFNIPMTYPEWKAHILAMYEECQKKWVFDQVTNSNQRDPKCSNPKPITSTPTSSKADGVTSLLEAKTTAPGRDSSTGRWTTYGGQGKPMDIDQKRMMNEGRCFMCWYKGHLSKDCPTKKEWWGIRAAETDPDLPKEEGKAEEVKE